MCHLTENLITSITPACLKKKYSPFTVKISRSLGIHSSKDKPDYSTKFKYNVHLHPKSANVYDSLGDALERTGNIEAAANHYRNAVKIGSELNDPNLIIYKQNLERVEAGI